MKSNQPRDTDARAEQDRADRPKKRKRKCGQRVWRGNGHFANHEVRCDLPATVKRNRRYYCRRHDPVRLLLREMDRLGIEHLCEKVFAPHPEAEHVLRIGEGRL